MYKWQVGDLGRFRIEDSKRPRFEVVGASLDKKSIKVWYGGSKDLQTIPLNTFRHDCTNLWEVQAPVPFMPAWLKEGSPFEFPRDFAFPEQLGEPPLVAVVMVRVGGQPLTIRRIRRGYASLLTQEGILVISPVAMMAKYGLQRPTRWQLLMSDEDPFEDPDARDKELFRGV